MPTRACWSGSIANIVENAVKYAPDSDIVLVGRRRRARARPTLAGRPAGELRIIDHGRGIPAERVLDMFRPFQRLDDAPQATGIGLGLAVAKGFTEAMGGSLTAEADAGRRPDHDHPAPVLHRAPRMTGTAPRPRSSRSH